MLLIIATATLIVTFVSVLVHHRFGMKSRAFVRACEESE